jgi:WD40 repeat protein
LIQENIIQQSLPFSDISWSYTGEFLASSSFDEFVKIFDSFGELIQTIDHGNAITDIAWNPTTNQLATAGIDNVVRVWNIEDGTQIQSINYSGIAYALVWSPDGDQLAYGGEFIGSPDDATLISDILPTCNNPNPITDTAALISEITAGNSFGAPYSICLENSSYTLNQVNNSSTGDNGLPVITGDIRIVGNGATITRDVAAADFRFFTVDPSGSLTLENVTLSNGSRFGLVAIYNRGQVEFNNSSCRGFLLCYLNFNHSK